MGLADQRKHNMQPVNYAAQAENCYIFFAAYFAAIARYFSPERLDTHPHFIGALPFLLQSDRLAG